MNFNNLYKRIKSNYKKIIIAFLIFSQFYILKTYIGYYSPLHIEYHIGLYPIFGLLFGGWGALGISFANLLTDLSGGYPPLETVICFFVDFIYAYLPYKLWYSFSKNNKLNAPQLGTIFHLAKFCGVILVSTIIYTLLIIMLLYHSQNISLFSLTTLNYFLNAFIFGFFSGVIGIIISNLKNINLTIPSVNENPRIKDKWYNLAFLISIVLIVVFFIIISIDKNQMTYINLPFIIAIIILILFYTSKPVRYPVIKEKSIYKPIIEKLILIFLGFIIGISLLFTSLAILIAVRTGESSLIIENSLGFTISILLYLFIGWLAFFIPGLIVLKYVEKNITNPLSLFSRFTKEYINSKDSKEVNKETLMERYQDYFQKYNEIGILGNSIIKMMSDLENVTSEKERISTELTLAKDIQESKLPTDFPMDKKYSINASMKPAREVGGDFYDFFEIDPENICIVIGDASGKGIPAALFAVIAKELIKTQLLSGATLEDTMESVNNRLCENNIQSMFVTAWAGIIDLRKNELKFVNAGHNSPLIKNGEKFEWLNFKHGLVLGAMENMPYKENIVPLKSDDFQIYLYTDGVTEAHNDEEELFNEDRLIELINNNDLDSIEFIDYLNEELCKFKGSREQFDDITMMIFKYKLGEDEYGNN